HQGLASLPGGVFGAMLVVMLLMFLLGFVLDFIEIVFVVVPIVAPVLLAMGVDPVWLGVMMAINLQTSFLTPPFGFALFYLRGVATHSLPTAKIYRGVAPFIVLQLLMLGLVASFPGLATALPEWLYGCAAHQHRSGRCRPGRGARLSQPAFLLEPGHSAGRGGAGAGQFAVLQRPAWRPADRLRPGGDRQGHLRLAGRCLRVAGGARPGRVQGADAGRAGASGAAASAPLHAVHRRRARAVPAVRLHRNGAAGALHGT